MNKEKLKTLALSPNSQNLFLALSIAEGMGCVEEVLEWWWGHNLIKQLCGKGELRYFNINTKLMKVSGRVLVNGVSIFAINGKFQPAIHQSNLIPLETIISNIKKYTFAYILHLLKHGD